ncbi:hypothetical protein I7I48_08182 [Histoplasma ohiense]|nr:hypothetical protein I7I48_08182 [Histoplasma ohiense (nom. inval.)]
MLFTPVNQSSQSLITGENITAGSVMEKILTEDMTMDEEIKEQTEEEQYTHSLEPGSCVHCLKLIGDVPLCVQEVAFKNCKRCHMNQSHCDPISLLK